MFCVDGDGRTVEAWQIPVFGGEAEEAVPAWLVDRILDHSLEITDLGGLQSMTSSDVSSVAIPGDYVVRYKDDTLLFCSNTTFATTYSMD